MNIDAVVNGEGMVVRDSCGDFIAGLASGVLRYEVRIEIAELKTVGYIPVY